MTIERTYQGAYRITDIINGHYISRQYFFYTKKEAVAEFKAEFNNQNKG